MTCSICGKPTLHGSDLGARPGTYLSESGCHNGVWMDDDEYAEGWQPDVIYQPCPNNPKGCKKCKGTGTIFTWSADKSERYAHDCPNKTCGGTGWKGPHQYPDDRYSQSTDPAQGQSIMSMSPLRAAALALALGDVAGMPMHPAPIKRKHRINKSATPASKKKQRAKRRRQEQRLARRATRLAR